MDYILGVPIPQSILPHHSTAAAPYGQCQQYSQHFTTYEPYCVGHPWAAGSSYAPVYPYHMPMVAYNYHVKEQQMDDTPPAAKKPH